MNGKEVLKRAAELYLRDDVGSGLFTADGHGLVRAVREAAGDDNDAYQDAYAILSDALSPEAPEYDFHRGGDVRGGPVARWAGNHGDADRKRKLVELSR